MGFALPPLTWLRSFEASARHLSFTHAAEELRLSQAAVSKQVKLLEGYLNEPLFIRHVRRLELTKSAQAYLPKVHDAFDRLDTSTAEVFGSSSSSKLLTIRISVTFSVNWLSKLLPDFILAHPDIRLRFISNIWNDEPTSNDYDLNIQYGTNDWSRPDIDRLTRESIAPLCTKGMIEQFGLNSPADLINMPLIQIMGYKEEWPVWLKAAGLSAKTVKFIPVDNSLLAYELAANNVGIALGRSSIMASELARNRLVKPFELETEVEEAFYMTYSKKGRLHPDVETFRSWIIEQIDFRS